MEHPNTSLEMQLRINDLEKKVTLLTEQNNLLKNLNSTLMKLISETKSSFKNKSNKQIIFGNGLETANSLMFIGVKQIHGLNDYLYNFPDDVDNVFHDKFINKQIIFCRLKSPVNIFKNANENINLDKQPWIDFILIFKEFIATDKIIIDFHMCDLDKCKSIILVVRLNYDLDDLKKILKNEFGVICTYKFNSKLEINTYLYIIKNINITQEMLECISPNNVSYIMLTDIDFFLN